jgi:hypothetical protein
VDHYFLEVALGDWGIGRLPEGISPFILQIRVQISGIRENL